MSTIANLMVKLGLNAKDFEKGVSSATKKSSKLKTGLMTVGKVAAGVAAGAAAVGTGMFAAANKFASAADRVDKLSQRLGISRQAFQEWDFILSQSGVSIDSMQNGLRTLAKRMGEAANGTGKGAEAFARLGISVYDSNGALKSQEEVFEEVVRALQGMEEGIEKANIAQELFGRNGQELLPLLNAKGGTIDELKQKAHELGLVMSDEMIDAGVLFTDTMDQAKRAMQAIFYSVAAEILPIFQALLDWVLKHLPSIKSVFSFVFDVIGAVIQMGVSWIQELMSWIENWVKSNRDSLSSIKDDFLRYLGMVWDFVRTVFNHIKDIIKHVMGLIVPFIQSQLAKIQAFWAENGEMIMQAVQNAFSFVKSVIETVMPAIKWIIEYIWGAIQGIISGALDVIMGLVQTFAALFTGNWSQAWEGVKQILSGAVTVILNILKLNLFRMGLNILRNLSTSIINIFRSLGTRVKELSTQMWNRVVEVFRGAVDRVTQPVFNIRDSIRDAFLGLVRSAKDWGRNMIQGFIDGIKSMLGKVGDAVSSVTSTVSRFLGFASPTEEGEGRFIEDWGANMLKGFMDGMKKQLPEFEKMLYNVIPAMDSMVGTIPSGIGIGTQSINYDLMGQTIARYLIPALSNSGGKIEALLTELIKVVREGKNIIMDDRVVGAIVETHVSEIQERNKARRERFAT
jgi:phage-related protein